MVCFDSEIAFAEAEKTLEVSSYEKPLTQLGLPIFVATMSMYVAPSRLRVEEGLDLCQVLNAFF